MFGIGEAVKELQNGAKVARAGWNGKEMYLLYINTRDFAETTEVRDFLHRPFVVMKTADNTIVPWLCSQSDLLAVDWAVVE